MKLRANLQRVQNQRSPSPTRFQERNSQARASVERQAKQLELSKKDTEIHKLKQKVRKQGNQIKEMVELMKYQHNEI